MKRDSIYIKFNLASDDWSRGLLEFKLPKAGSLNDFSIKSQDGLCFGYFQGLQHQLSPQQISLKICQNDWLDLTREISHYLIFYIDFRLKKINLVSDMFSSISCLFMLEDNFITFSNDYGLLVKHQKSRRLDIDGVLKALTILDIASPSISTILQNIYALPPITLLTVGQDKNVSFKSLAEIDRFNFPIEPHRNSQEFIEELLDVGDKVIRQWVDTIGARKIAVELSSGFDCSLVAYLLSRLENIELFCYSRTSSISPEDTYIPAMMDFVKLHSLNLTTLQADDLYPLCNDHDLKIIEDYFYPFDHGQEMMSNLLDLITVDGISSGFTGFGGDELYFSNEWGEYAKYPIQIDYFDLVAVYDWDIDRIFTEAGLQKLQDRGRFINQQPFYTYASSSAVSCINSYSILNWSKGFNSFSPLMDPRLLQVARRIPIVDGHPVDRQKLWEHRKDIFPESYFRPKGHFQAHVNQYLTKKKEVIVAILENSVLGKLGLIKSEEIVSNLKSGNIELYLDKPSMILRKLVYLEYFLQKHKIYS